MTPLHELIRRLPPGVEFLIVVSWAFGLPIFRSIVSFGTGGEVSAASGGALVYNDSYLFSVLVYELIQAAFLLWFLHVRGWTLRKVGLAVTWRGTGQGWLLLLATYVLVMAVLWLAQQVFPAEMQAAGRQYPVADPQLSMELLFLTSTVNGIYEELFVAGYIITALAQTRGVWVGINVSAVVRVLYHVYQGPQGVIANAALGVMYGYVYARTRQLWPLIFAHVFVDIIGLSPLGRMLEEWLN